MEAVIGHWMEANGYSGQSGLVADTLRRKADEVDYDFYDEVDETIYDDDIRDEFWE